MAGLRLESKTILRRFLFASALAGVFLSLLGVTALAQPPTTTKVELVLGAEEARPGDTVMAGIRLTMQPGWDTYWRNSGGVGIPTAITWRMPHGITAGPIQWPVPEVQKDDPFINYIYRDEVILLSPLKLDGTLAAGKVSIEATVVWEECSNLCVTGKTQVSGSLEIGAETRPSFELAAIQAAQAKVPKADPDFPVTARWESDDDKRPLILDWATTNKPAEVDFLPYESTNFGLYGQVERLADEIGHIRIKKFVTNSGPEWPASIPGIWVVRETSSSEPVGHEITLNIPPRTELPRVASEISKLGLLSGLGLAFLGGLVLNIMPCVLPVIALKILGFVSQAREQPRRVRMLGLVYGVGVLVSFLVLAAAAIGVQKAGGTPSWSAAFQNPQFRVILTTLITLVALNLFGVFEVTVGSQTMTSAVELTSKKGPSGAFFNGVLATLLATPCTAPFLASALGFAFTQPPAIIILIFLTIGLGLAAPYVLLCWQPAWLKFLPKPGLWMQRFKVAMGFPLLAAAVWLFWVTATRMGKSGVLWFGLFLVAIALAGWVWGEFAQRGSKRPGLAIIISLVIAGSAYGFILEDKLHWRLPPNSVVKPDAISWQTWSASAVSKARASGRPVLVDFTADTCVNCQANLFLSIDVASTRSKLKQINAVTLEGDYTDQNADIARELKRYGQAGVPLVLVYPADTAQQPIVMPPRFSESEILSALDKVAKH